MVWNTVSKKRHDCHLFISHQTYVAVCALPHGQQSASILLSAVLWYPASAPDLGSGRPGAH
jgi:hypothetical protein